MNPHILFLDIDGVLNNRDSMSREPFVQHFEGQQYLGQFDEDCIARLNRLLKEGRFDVVLSSTWRFTKDLPTLWRYFAHCGIEANFIGATDRGWRIAEEDRWSHRGEEIDWWLRERSDTRPFIILDDDSDMNPHMNRLVRTDGLLGLQDAQVEEALTLIGVT